MIRIYPAIFEKDPVGLGVEFPDVENAVTQGKDVAEALENASDVLGIQLSWNIENDIPLPEPTPINDIEFDPASQFISLVQVDLSDYLKDTKADKKTVKIPHWLNVKAEKEGINFSRTLTEALYDKVGIN